MKSACKGPKVQSKRCSAFLKNAVCAYYYKAFSQYIYEFGYIYDTLQILLFLNSFMTI